MDQQLHRPVLTLPPVVLHGGREEDPLPASPLVEYPEDDDEYLYNGGLQSSHSHSSSTGDRFCVEVRSLFSFDTLCFYFGFGFWLFGYIC